MRKNLRPNHSRHSRVGRFHPYRNLHGKGLDRKINEDLKKFSHMYKEIDKARAANHRAIDHIRETVSKIAPEQLTSLQKFSDVDMKHVHKNVQHTVDHMSKVAHSQINADANLAKSQLNQLKNKIPISSTTGSVIGSGSIARKKKSKVDKSQPIELKTSLLFVLASILRAFPKAIVSKALNNITEENKNDEIKESVEGVVIPPDENDPQTRLSIAMDEHKQGPLILPRGGRREGADEDWEVIRPGSKKTNWFGAPRRSAFLDDGSPDSYDKLLDKIFPKPTRRHIEHIAEILTDRIVRDMGQALTTQPKLRSLLNRLIKKAITTFNTQTLNVEGMIGKIDDTVRMHQLQNVEKGSKRFVGGAIKLLRNHGNLNPVGNFIHQAGKVVNRLTDAASNQFTNVIDWADEHPLESFIAAAPLIMKSTGSLLPTIEGVASGLASRILPAISGEEVAGVIAAGLL